MKNLALLLAAICLSACSKKETVAVPAKTNDTVVVREANFSKYYPKSMAYRLVIAGDTTKTGVAVFQDENGELRMGIGLDHSGNGTDKSNQPYAERLAIAKRLMKEVAEDFNLDSLNNVGTGRLIGTGDLTVEITKEYYKKYGNPGDSYWGNMSPEKQLKVYDFVGNSRLAKDVDMLLTPFGKKIEKVAGIEKLMFTPKKYFLKYGTIEADTASLPDYILDGSIDLKITDTQ